MKLVGKNILVTGGCGLVGSHLVKDLLEKKARVVVPQRSFDPHSFFTQEKLYKKTTMVDCDIKNFKRVFDIVTKYEIEFIFHLAAQPIVETAYYNPLETLETNIMGTVNILETARLYRKVKGIIVASSDKAYGKLDKVYKETDPLKGDHPYEVSKSCADLVAHTYYKTYGLSVAITRFGNIYGPGDLNFNRLIPGIMESLIKNKVLKIRSNGKCIRDFIYIKDVVKAYILIAENIEKTMGEVFNISTDETYSVLEAIKKVETILKKKIKYKILNIARNEISYQSLNYQKIKKSLGWRPTYDFNKTIPIVFNWYNNLLLKSN